MTPGENYFELFGLPPSYRIDRAGLDAAYEKLSLENHPDFFASAPPEEQQRALVTTSRLNQGYGILTADDRRAAYLLELLAGANGQELDTGDLPPGFLQQMFALQEELDEIEGGGGADAEAIAALSGQVDSRLAKVAEERERMFANVESGEQTEALQAIQSNLNCEKYLRRLLERLAGFSS